MKRLMSLSVAGLFALSLGVACGDDGGGDTSSNTSADTTVTETSTSTTNGGTMEGSTTVDPSDTDPSTSTTDPTDTDPSTGTDTLGGDVCEPDADDDECATCTKTMCCDELTACYADEVCVCAVECVQAGGSVQDCLGKCGISPAAVPLQTCTGGNCPTCAG